MYDKTLYIAITFDTESDFGVRGSEISPPEWNNLESVRAIREALASITQELRCTWFVRADDQLDQMFSDPCYLLKSHAYIWELFENQGDEIGWHPHIYRFENNVWKPETDDARMIASLENVFADVKEFRPGICSSRIGEAYQSNAIMGALDRLGIKVDSTAMPGRIRADQERVMDWSKTPGIPYFPSTEDYRVPGQQNLAILEAPMTMVETKVSYDQEPLRRYLNLSFRHEVMRPGLTHCAENRQIIVSITHPFEILKDFAPEEPHPLLSYSIDNAVENLSYLLERCKDLNRPVQFIIMSDIPKLVASGKVRHQLGGSDVL